MVTSVIIVSSGVISSGLTLGSGISAYVSSGGELLSTTVNSGGFAFVSAGGSAVDTAVNGSGVQWVNSGATETGTVVSGTAAFDTVYGSSISATIGNGGGYHIEAGGSAVSVTNYGNIIVYAGGTLIGGTVYADTLNNYGHVDSVTLSGGFLETYSGASSSKSTVKGGEEDVYSGGSVLSMTVMGGKEVVSSGGSATSTTVSIGGTEIVRSGAIVSGLVISSGGQVVLSSGANLAGGTLLAGGKIDLPFLSFVSGSGSTSYDSASHSLTVTEGAVSATVQNIFITNAVSLVTSAGTTNIVAACYAEGTRIATPDGEQAIEALRVGDLVLNAEGETRNIVWLGRRHLDCLRQPAPELVWPVRISAGALADGLPARDLLLSPEHALLLNGFLMPARALLNGATVTQDKVASITYWHLELSGHDAILAEGVASETYLDTGNRNAFEGQGDVMTLHPRFGRNVHNALACAPFADTGRAVEQMREHLIGRAAKLGFSVAAGAWWIEADGVALVAEPDGTYLLPAFTRLVGIRSASSRPMDLTARHDDTRRLGLCLNAITLDGQEMALNHAALAGGFYEVEDDGMGCWRWTDGAAVIDLGPNGRAGARRLELSVAKAPMRWRRASAA